MGIDHASRRAAPPRHTRPSTALPAPGEPARNVVDAVMELQRTAGNMAVATELGSIQRDDAGAPATEEKDTPKAVSEIWGELVIDQLAEAKDYLVKDSQRAWQALSHVVQFIVDAMEVVPRNHPTWIKLRILGIEVDGIRNVLADRLKDTNAANVTDDLRFSYRQAVDIGPELNQPDAVESWNEAAVYPIGRAILKVEADKDLAVIEAAAALEVVNARRVRLRKDHPAKLRLIMIERTLKYAVERLQQQARGQGEVDIARDLDAAIEEAGVFTTVLANTPPKPAPPPAAAKNPFVNDTELMRPGD
jgi:hypothetical protein